MSTQGLQEITTINQDDVKTYYDSRTFQEVKRSMPEHSLVMFLMQLTSYLQQSIGTVVAIDMQKYLSNIGETIDKFI